MRLVLVLVLAGCKVSTEAPVSFDEALLDVYTSFRAEEATLAPALRELEEQIYAAVTVDAKDTVARSIAPGPLSEAEVADLEERPDRDPAACAGIAVAWPSPHDVEAHAALPLLPDQRPLEPSSPDHFNREFLDGEDCWEDRSCAWLTTFQDLTKVYGIIQPITYEFFKDFRWVNLNADTGGAERWAYLAKSWNPDTYSSEKGDNILWQSYTLELWLPRDGGGFVWDTEPAEADQGDSSAGGTLRFLSLWSENEMGISDDPELIAGTIRWGMDRNYEAHDVWIDEHP
jgi:hypothetical protein